MGKSLYQLTADFEALLDLAESAEPADQQMFADTMEGLQGDIEAKLINCAAVVKSIESQADAVKAEEKRLAGRRKALESSAGRLVAYMQASMEKVGLTKVKSDLFSLSIQNNPKSVQLDPALDVTKLPAKYKRVTIEADRSAIKEDLAAGVEVEGASLVQTKSLRIR